MRLLGKRILIEADEPVKQSASGILIQEDWETRPPYGTVLAVGPDVTEVKKGDRVVFERFGSIMMPEKNQRLCLEEHMLAVLDES